VDIAWGPVSTEHESHRSRREIVRAAASFEVEEFSPQMWEPFEAWVSEAYPDDATAMYENETHTGVQLSEESVRLWRRHVREYVKEVKEGTA
jgi:hypothetical protein